ncbi:MAG: 6-phosphofructokinase [Anaerolineales bacterium]|jgi:6-phosphofructokinase 1
MMEKIGVLTSGGDSPGMNPCIRAIVRTARSRKIEVAGIIEGYNGLVHGEMRDLTSREVGGIIERGGTMLQTARSEEFRTKKGQREAIREMNEEGIEGLVVIGGDGSLRGAHALTSHGIPVVGVPASIDNDIWGTDMSIGVDTALNTIIDAVDKLRDTASSHNRAFIVETMGRNCGYLALIGAVISGAEMVLLPEHKVELQKVADMIENSYIKGKNHAIILVAEGSAISAGELAAKLEEMDVGFTTRVTILGHIQRGGSPTAFDRLLATRLGVKAVDALLSGETDVMVGLQGKEIELIPLNEVTTKSNSPDMSYYDILTVVTR